MAGKKSDPSKGGRQRSAADRDEALQASNQFYERQVTLRIAIRALAWVLFGLALVWAVHDTATAFAGKDTNLNFGVKLLANKYFATLVASLVGVGGTSAAVYARRQTGRVIEREHKRTVALEKRLDPNRTSANLTPTGKPRKTR